MIQGCSMWVLLGFLRVIAVVMAVILITLQMGGYAGALHPIGDSLAVFRAQGAAGLLAMALFAWPVGLRTLAGLSGVIAAVTAAPLLLAYAQAGSPGEFTLYQKNLLFQNDDLPAMAADIGAASPAMITLQEVSVPNMALLEALSDTYPTQHFCNFSGVGGTAVLTRYPPVPGTETCAHGLTALQVTTEAGPVWLISIHQYWPWPYQQAAQNANLVGVIAGLTGPKVIGGDFNMVPWSHAMAGIAAAGDVRFAGPVRGTYRQFGPLLGLPIDHVLTPLGGTTELRPLAGSDHHGLLVRFALAP
jgi:endonuclease/exonuclease/phosphatase (EEP) superfamily protein YafD